MIESKLLDEKRKAVQKVGWNLKLKEGKLVWTYQKPYDVLLIPEYRSNVSRGEDSNLGRVTPLDLQSNAIGHSATSGILIPIYFIKNFLLFATKRTFVFY